MGIESLHHLYIETNSFEASVDFWKGLGFAFAEEWGSEGHRAGRLINSGASVVLAEVDGQPAFNAFFSASDLAQFTPGPGVDVVTPLEETHWQTKWMRVRDPDGRIYAIEEAS